MVVDALCCSYAGLILDVAMGSMGNDGRDVSTLCEEEGQHMFLARRLRSSLVSTCFVRTEHRPVVTLVNAVLAVVRQLESIMPRGIRTVRLGRITSAWWHGFGTICLLMKLLMGIHDTNQPFDCRCMVRLTIIGLLRCPQCDMLLQQRHDLFVASI